MIVSNRLVRAGASGRVPEWRLMLPRGRPLPVDAWQRRHRLIIWLLWAHAVGLAGFGVLMGQGVGHSVLEVLPIAAAAVGANARRLGRRVRGAVASLGLITASAVLVHFSGGYVEMHFHFFVMLAVIAMYQDWLPYTLAIGYVALHHGVVGALAPGAVYNHPDAVANPWKWAAIHAVFVLAASAASIANWRLHESDRERREASEARLRLIMGQVPAVLWATDAALRLTSVQGADSRLRAVGQAGDALVGVRLQEWLGTEDLTAPPLAAHVRALGGTPSAYEHERDGRSLRAQVDPLRGPDGAITGTVAAEVDVTELREAVRARDEFLSIAAHELRTPVTGVKASAQIMRRLLEREAVDAARLRALAEAAVTASNRLATLVNDLLDVSRIRADRLGLRPEPTDLGELLTRVVTEHGERLDGRHRLALEVPGQACVVAADVGRMEQVLVNLLENAVKYSPEGGRIEVELAVDGGTAWVRVRDEGIGLPPGAEEEIFRPFGRAANATARNLPGMGLGLYICRNIAEQHQGRLWAESGGEGHGTTLVLTLPCVPSEGTGGAGAGVDIAAGGEVALAEVARPVGASAAAGRAAGSASGGG